jgi:protein-S-isoprenylcysteine O-methyltransferase Ste14
VSVFAADTPRDTVVAWSFVVVQFVLLVLILLLPSGDLWTAPPWLDLLARVLEWVGAAVLVVALVNLGRSLTPLPSPVPHGELRTGGLFRLVRHPIYSGIMGLTIGVSIRSGSLGVVAATVGLVGWFMLKARWEEARLVVRYPGYAAYAAHTPRFVPFWPT